MKRDNNIPIYTMLKEYKEKKPLPFHMPGHILGRGLYEEFRSVGSLDITEIPGSDCLHAPNGAIKDAQDKASHCFGADYSFFLVNGSSSGIQAMIQAVLEPGGKLILGRDSHISVLNTLAQLNGEPVFIMPKVDKETQIPLGVTQDKLRAACKANPDAQGILITRPNYYGIAVKLEEIVEIANDYNMPLLIDEAHGAHFVFHEDFPRPCMSLGADLCVQSLHKTLPALTQTAILHGKNNALISKSRVETTTSMVQTTSPSYLLMCSIDIARYIMQTEGKALYNKLKNLILNFDRQLEKFSYIKRVAQNYEGYDNDFTRIVLSFNNTDLGGSKAEEILRTRYGIVAEMADLNHVVLITSPFHTVEDFDKLILALKDLDEKFGKSPKERGQDFKKSIKCPDIPERSIPLRRAMFSKHKEIPIYKSEGYISGGYITPYPPGIPIVCPGEIIDESVVNYISNLLRENCPIHGVKNNNVKVVEI